MIHRKKAIAVFVVCLSSIFCLVGMHQPAYASGYTTNGFVEFTKSSEEKENTSNSEEKEATKDSGKKPFGKLPSTGMSNANPLFIIGIGFLVVFLGLLFFHKIRRRKDEK